MHQTGCIRCFLTWSVDKIKIFSLLVEADSSEAEWQTLDQTGEVSLMQGQSYIEGDSLVEGKPHLECDSVVDEGFPAENGSPSGAESCAVDLDVTPVPELSNLSITSPTTPTLSDSPGALSPLESTRIEATPTKSETSQDSQEFFTPHGPASFLTTQEPASFFTPHGSASPYVPSNQNKDPGFNIPDDPNPNVPIKSISESSIASNLNPDVAEFKPTGLYDAVKPISPYVNQSKQEPLRSGDKVYVTWVCDPHNFKVIAAEQKLELEKLMEQMDTHYNARVSRFRTCRCMIS